MSIKQIHVTGHGMLTPLGLDTEEVLRNTFAQKSFMRLMPQWQQIEGLHCHIAGVVPDYDITKDIPRIKRRTMSKMSEMICLAAREALEQASLSDDLEKRKVVIIVGSTTGSPTVYEETLRRYHESNTAKGQLSTNVFKCMSHSAVVNLCSYLNFHGPAISPNAACSTSSQAIILGKQLIQSGFADIAIVGGTDECHSTSCMSFDAAYAASRSYNEIPNKASRPFDRDRDGIVVSEGAAILVLESEDSMNKRKAISCGRIVGGAYRTHAEHMSQPNVESISLTITEALQDADITASDIGYVNAHATSTPVGDIKESQAIYNTLGEKPVSSLKGHMGHTFAACGAIEAILSLKMLQTRSLIPTLNLNTPDQELAPLHYLQEKSTLDKPYLLSNNFAFGGMNTAMVLSL